MLSKIRPLSALITGGAGFIGSYLTQNLIDDGCHVTVLDDFSAGPRQFPAHPGLRVIRGSVLNPEAVHTACRGADFVFHLAGLVGMDRVTSQAELTYHTSLAGTLNILRFSHPVPIVVFSSSAVYGLTRAGTQAGEADGSRERALDYDGKHRGYASGKWQMERLAESAARSGRPVMTIRPFNVVGAGQSGDGGMVIPRLVRQALSGEPLTIYGDGSQGRCFSEVSTFINCILRLCDSPGAWPHGGGCFNVGTQTSTSILDLARIVIEETGSDSRVEHHRYESIFPHKTDVAQRVPDVKRLTDAVGPTAWPRLRDIVSQYVTSVERERVAVGAH